MVDFGFTIHQDRQVDLDKSDLRIARYVYRKEPSSATCISCGTCTATCSANNFTDFNIRRLATLLRIGDTANLKTEIQKCMLCGKCQLACPRGVNTRNIILNIKKAIEKIERHEL